MRLELPWPPSLNAIYRARMDRSGRVVKKGKSRALTRVGREYARRIVYRYLEQRDRREPLEGRLHVTLWCFAPDRRRRDLANLEKCLCDSLTKARVWGDDSQIKHLELVECGVEQGGVIVVDIEQIAADVLTPTLAELRSGWRRCPTSG